MRRLALILLGLLPAGAPLGAQNLVDSGQALPGVWAGQAAWGDYDGDGNPDLALIGEASEEGQCLRIARLFRFEQVRLVADQAQDQRLVGVYFGDVAWADYDGDGDLDLSIAGWDESGEESLRLYQNAAGETRLLSLDRRQVDALGNPVLKGVRYASLAWGDFDSDGDLDLVVAGMEHNGTSLTQVYRNAGGVLELDEANSQAVVNVHNGDLAWGDFDSDGDLDLMVSGENVTTTGGLYSVTELYKNDPLGTLNLDPSVVVDNKLKGGGVAWADYDGDGNLDLAVSGRDFGYHYNNQGEPQDWLAFLHLYRNRPAGVLIRDASFTLNTSRRLAARLAWVDYDNDGDPDLAASGSSILSDYKTLVFANRDGALSGAPVEEFPGLAGGAAVWADHDNDGRADLLVSGVDSTGERHTILYSNLGPQANTPPLPPSRLNPVQVHGDKALFSWAPGSDVQSADLTYNLRIGTEEGSSDIFSGAIPVGPGNVGAKTSFALGRFLPPDTYYWSVQAVDGASARSEWSQSDQLVVQQFVSSDQRLRALKESAMSWGDFDQDGDLDLALMGQNRSGEAQSLLYENENGALQARQDVDLPGLRNGDLAWGDFDSDGDLDLLLTGEDIFENRSSLLYRARAGALERTGSFPKLSHSSADWGDYDNDGDLDLVLMGQSDEVEGGQRQSSTLVFLNDGQGGFVDAGLELLGLNNGEAAWGDADNDGDLDLAVTGSSAADTREFRLLRNEAGLADAGLGLPGLESSDLAWGDFDQDGDLDLVAGGIGAAGPTTALYQNDGSGQLTALADLSLPGIQVGDLAWGDFDNDQDLDLVIAGNDGSQPLLEVYQNTLGRADATEPFEAEPLSILQGVDFSAISLADIEGDGDLDLISSGQDASFSPTTAVNDNLAAQQFNPNRAPQAPAGLAAADSASAVVLSWLAASDEGDPPPASLTYNLRVGTSPGSGEVLSGSGPLGSGNAGHGLRLRLGGLESGTYYWSAQTVDAGFSHSQWSAPQAFVIDTEPPRVEGLSLSRQQAGIGQTITLALNFADEHSGVDPQVIPRISALLGGQEFEFRTVQFTGPTWSGELTLSTQMPSGPASIAVRGLQDYKGNQLVPFDSAGAFVADTEIPRLIASIPAADAVDVPVATGQVSATFSEALDEATLTGENFQLQLDGASLSLLTAPAYDPATRTVTLVPAAGLLPGSRYTISVSASVQDLAGNRPANALAWTFATQVPQLQQTTPAAEDTAASLSDGRLSARFDAPLRVDLLSTPEVVRVLREGEPQALRETPQFNAATHTLSFELADGFRPGSRYQVVLSGALAGPLQEGDFRWQFRTPVPQMVRTAPADGDTAVATEDVAIAAVFDTPLDEVILQQPEAVEVLRSGVEIEVEVEDYNRDTRTLRLRVAEGLRAGTGYQVKVEAAVGGPLRQAEYSWRFNTAIPRLLRVVPDSGTEDVGLDLSEARVEFSAPLDADRAVAENFALLREGEAVALRPGDPVGRASGVYGLAPAAGWQVGSTYTVQISPAVTGPLGSGQPITWQFRTAVPDTVRVFPAAGDTAVAGGGEVRAEFDHPLDQAQVSGQTVRVLREGEPEALREVRFEEETNRLVCELADGFRPGSRYEVVLSAVLAGPLREGDFRWGFRTPVPQIAQTTPADGDTAVATEDAGIAAIFDASLDEAALQQPEAVEVLRSGKEVDLSGVEYNPDTRTLRLSVREGLRAGTAYQVIVAAAVGGPLRQGKGAFSWSFSTAVPQLESATPEAGSSDVGIELAEAVARFTTPLDADRAVAENFALLREGEAVALRPGDPVGRASGVYGLAPAAGWQVGSTYTVQISPAVTGPLGSGQPITWQFRTTVPDTVGVFPAAGDTAVVGGGEVRAEFDHPLDQAQVSGQTVRVLREGEAAALRGTPQFDPAANILSFELADGFRPGSRYEVVLSGSLAGPLGQGDFRWGFRTPVPQIAQTTPVDGDTAVVAGGQELQVEFTHELDKGLLRTDDAAVLRNGEVAQIQELIYGERKLRIPLAEALRAGTNYQVRLAAVLGGPLRQEQGDFSWSFSTRVPAIERTDPPAGGAIPAGPRRLQVVFSSPIDTAQVTPQNFRLSRGGAVVSLDKNEFQYDPGTRTVSFPFVDFLAGSGYEAVVSSRVSGPLGAGRPDVQWAFFTAVPAVLSTVPADGAEGVSIALPTLQVAFSGPVASRSAEFFQLRARSLETPEAAPEVVSLTTPSSDISGTLISFAPQSGLKPFTEYQVVVDRQVLGELVEEDFTWRFSTASRLANPAAGGKVTNAAQTVELYFPPNALQGGTGEVVIRPQPAVAGKPLVQGEGLTRVGQAYLVDAGGGALLKPATLTLRYTAEELGDRKPERLGIFRLAGDQWQRVGGTAEPGLRQVRTAVEQLGVFALFEDQRTPVGSLALEKLDCQPRAFAPAGGALRNTTDISFEISQAENVTVRVYNLSGRLEQVIWSDRPVGPGRNTLSWDGLDEDGQVVASGLYIVVVTAGSVQREQVVAVVR